MKPERKATPEQRIEMYRQMLLIRQYEDRLAMAYFEGKLAPKIQKGLAFDLAAGPVPGEMHLSAGQESAAVATCIHLKKGDTVWGTHRSHHFAIARGVDLNKMTAEIYGKETGLCKGRGGHMHLFDPDVGYSCTGIVGGGIPHAVGGAFAIKMKHKTDNVAVAEFGEGASNQGSFHESLNIASLWKLPVVFVCQDNGYGISVPKGVSTSVANIASRGDSYNIPWISVPENDPDLMFAAAQEAVERGRRGEGPTLIEVKVYRYYGHFQGDPEPYRPKGEVDGLKEIDPIDIYRERLISEGVLDKNVADELMSQTKLLVDKAIVFAVESPYPDVSTAYRYVFSENAELSETEQRN